MVFWWCTLIRNSSITSEASDFSKIPSVNVHFTIVGLYYLASIDTLNSQLRHLWNCWYIEHKIQYSVQTCEEVGRHESMLQIHFKPVMSWPKPLVLAQAARVTLSIVFKSWP